MPRDCNCAMSSLARCWVSTRPAMIVAILLTSDAIMAINCRRLGVKKNPARSRGFEKDPASRGRGGEGRGPNNQLSRTNWLDRVVASVVPALTLRLADFLPCPREHQTALLLAHVC